MLNRDNPASGFQISYLSGVTKIPEHILSRMKLTYQKAHEKLNDIEAGGSRKEKTVSELNEIAEVITIKMTEANRKNPPPTDNPHFIVEDDMEKTYRDILKEIPGIVYNYFISRHWNLSVAERIKYAIYCPIVTYAFLP